jgi:hypothetical protein
VDDEIRSAFVRGKIIALCEGILREEIGVIPGSRILNGLEFDLFDYPCGEIKRDDDFLLFVAIDSETDHLPVDRERANWSEEALARKDSEIAKAEAFYKDSAFRACRKLIERFNIDGT